MKFGSLLLFILCYTIGISPGSAQEYNYTRYTTRDGLAGETTYTMLQDHEGFLWIGTETGISRFDGKQFKNFTVADGLPTNEVFGFYQDLRNRLWIISFSKEICYYYKGRIHNKKNDSLVQQIQLAAEILSITEHKNGTLVFADLEKGTVLIDSAGRVSRYGKNRTPIQYEQIRAPGFAYATITSLPPDLKVNMQKYLNWPLKADIRLWPTLYGYTLFTDSWHKKILVSYEGSGELKLLYRPEHLKLEALDKDKLLESYKTGGGGIYNLTLNRRTDLFLPRYIVNGIYVDTDKNMWFGTKGSGLFKLCKSKILSYRLGDEQVSVGVQFIHKKKSNIFIGLDNQQFWQLSETTQGNYNEAPFFHKKEIAGGRKWLKKNAQGRYINCASADFLKIRQPNIVSIKSLQAWGDVILVSNPFGTYIFENSSGKVLKTLYSKRATSAIRYGDYYYIGTLYGLLVLDTNGQLVSRPLTQRISYFAPGKDGLLWVSTYDAGVFSLKGTKINSVINQKNSAISSNLCRCIFEDGRYLWVGTDKGLNKIAITNTSCTVTDIYTSADGLNADIINTVLVADSIVYVGTPQGLNIFNENLNSQRSILNLKLTAIAVSDSSINIDEPLILPHDDNNIKFDFSGISFSLNKLIYRYRLLGYDQRWQTTEEQTLNFISLPSGKYKFQLQAVSALGHKSAIIEKEFQVQQAIYEQWWFRILVGIAGVTLLWIVFLLRIKKIRHSEEEKRSISRKMIELEQTALRAQMNPHFIFNCLNSIQQYILKQDVLGANFYLSEFAGLVRKTLEHASRLEITLQEEITYLRHYIELERLQANQPFDFNILIGSNINAGSVLIPNMIIQPFVENAIKHGLQNHGHDGYLNVDFLMDNVLICIIEDNGPGIGTTQKAKSSRDYNSRGILLIRERIKTLNLLRPSHSAIHFDIHDLRDTGKQGTKVTVYIPNI